MTKTRWMPLWCGTLTLVALAVTLGAVPRPLDAQQPVPAVVDSLRAQMARLQAELDSLRAQVESGGVPGPTSAADPAQQQQDELARLRAAAAAAAGQQAGDADSTDAPQEFVGRQRSLQALNPEISVSADLFGAVQEGSAGRDNFVPREFEFAFQSALDPYSRAKIFVGIETPGAEIEPFAAEGEEEEEEGGHLGVEEGYVEWVNLPGGLSAKLGKFYQSFGQLNRWHSHALPFQSRSLPHLAFIGEEPLGQTGASVHLLLPFQGVGTYETTFEVTRSSNGALFGESNRLSYLGHVNGFFEITDAVDLDLGVSGVFGTYESEAGTFDQRLFGVEGALTWTPPGRSLYRGTVVRGGIMFRNPGESSDAAFQAPASATGTWVLAETRVGRQWLFGGRFDWVENPEDASDSSWLLGPTLTWWQSEWVRIRAEYAHLNRTAEATGLFTLQVTLAMGPHKHETY